MKRKTAFAYDRDALLIYKHNYDDETRRLVESTAIYQHGKDLHEKAPQRAVQNTRNDQKSSGTASSWFRLAFGREPAVGEVLSYDDVELVYRVHLGLAQQFIDAWHRHFAGMKCPLSIEEDRLLRRADPRFNDGKEWIEEARVLRHPHDAWLSIEQEVGDKAPTWVGDKTTSVAVAFAGLTNGDSKWTLAGASDVELKVPEATGGIHGILARAAVRIGLKKP